MKVICLHRKRSNLDQERCRVFAASEAYELTIGTLYIVYGQSLVAGCLLYLIDPLTPEGLTKPTWYPADFFSVAEGSIPSSWIFSYTSASPGREVQYPSTAVWGYAELALSNEHFVGLQEREEKDMLIFLRRKAAIDSEEGGGDSAD